MADITIAGTIKVSNTTRTPGFIYAYPMTDFYLGLIGFQSSSPHTNDLPFKKIAVGAGAAGTGVDVGTTLYTFSIILPSTEDATVNPDGARFGLYVFDNASTPRLISEVSGLASARIPVTPTTHPAKDLALYNGGSLAPISVNVDVSGTLDVAGLATFEDVVINGTLNGQGVIGGSGVTDRISYWTDADTLASSPFLRIDSDTVEQRGSGGANILHVSAGYVSDTDYSRAVISATTAVVIYGVERDGSAADIPVRLASCNGGVIQFFQDGTNQWTIDGDGHFVPNGQKNLGEPSNPAGTLHIATGMTFYVAANQQAAITCPATDIIAFPDSTGLLHSKLRYGAGVYLFSGTGDPEGVETASPGSIFSSTSGSVYKKTTGAGNTGWDELASAAPGYLVYRALLTQSGGSAPVATVFENTLGGTVVWTRGGVGDYTATLAGAFTANKTMVFVGSSWITGQDFAVIKSVWVDAGSIHLDTADVSPSATTYAAADNILSNTEISVLVYP